MISRSRESRGRSNTNDRGNTRQRRKRKQKLLDDYGDGNKAPCWECGTPVTIDTMYVDRRQPGEQGGRYHDHNIRIHCQTCSCRQGQRRTTELRKGPK